MIPKGVAEDLSIGNLNDFWQDNRKLISNTVLRHQDLVWWCNSISLLLPLRGWNKWFISVFVPQGGKINFDCLVKQQSNICISAWRSIARFLTGEIHLFTWKSCPWCCLLILEKAISRQSSECGTLEIQKRSDVNPEYLRSIYIGYVLQTKCIS